MVQCCGVWCKRLKVPKVVLQNRQWFAEKYGGWSEAVAGPSISRSSGAKYSLLDGGSALEAVGRWRSPLDGPI